MIKWECQSEKARMGRGHSKSKKDCSTKIQVVFNCSVAKITDKQLAKYRPDSFKNLLHSIRSGPQPKTIFTSWRKQTKENPLACRSLTLRLFTQSSIEDYCLFRTQSLTASHANVVPIQLYTFALPDTAVVPSRQDRKHRDDHAF